MESGDENTGESLGFVSVRLLWNSRLFGDVWLAYQGFPAFEFNRVPADLSARSFRRCFPLHFDKRINNTFWRVTCGPLTELKQAVSRYASFFLTFKIRKATERSKLFEKTFCAVLIYCGTDCFSSSRCPNKWTGLSETDCANNKRNHQRTRTGPAPTGIFILSESHTHLWSVCRDTQTRQIKEL